MALSAAERRLRSQMGAYVSWANTDDRAGRTAPARRALEAKFLIEAGGDPVRAEALRRAHFAALSFKSVQARRLAKEARAAADEADRQAGAADAEIAVMTDGDDDAA